MTKIKDNIISLGEKIGYGLGDTAANLAWRPLTAFLLIFYTDVFGISAAAAGVLLLVTRLSDGVTDIAMGMIADRTNTKYGKFRPWILWTAVPFGVVMALTFTTPDLSETGKLVYAYATYITLTLLYTANNVPYSALMGVITPNTDERVSISSFRFAGAYLGGLISQGGLLYLVYYLGQGDENLGYQYSMYFFAALLIIFSLITFYSTRERVKPTKISSKSDVLNDLKDLLRNKPWLILLVIGFVFVTYNSIKQGITVMYFKRYANNEILAASYFITLLLVSILAAFITTPLAKRFGKKRLLTLSMISSGLLAGSIYFCSPTDIVSIFILGNLSEIGAAIIPVLFFSMLGDASDYSEYKTSRRATGLVYSAGTFAMKFGGGVAGAIAGFILSAKGYDGQSELITTEALEGIKQLMSVIPAVIVICGTSLLYIYPLNNKRMVEIETELETRRSSESSHDNYNTHCNVNTEQISTLQPDSKHLEEEKQTKI